MPLPRRLSRLPPATATPPLPPADLTAERPPTGPPAAVPPSHAATALPTADPTAALPAAASTAAVLATARVARGPLSRLLGLALLARPPTPVALLLPRTRSVHTAGMRFALDLHWLDAAGRVVRVDRDVGPWRVRTCRTARWVVEAPSARISSCPR